jgi:hypothetical protein
MFMNLPYSTQNVVTWIDPGQKFVTYNYTAAPNIASISNRIGFQSVAQAVSANQPTYAQTSAMNNHHTMNFVPTQYLVGSIAGTSLLSGTNSISVTFVASATTNIANNMVSLYSAAQDGYFFEVKQAASTGITVTRTDSSGVTDTVTHTGVFAAATAAVITASWDTSFITLRVNGTQVAQSATTGGAITLDTLCIGAGPAGTGTGFTGAIGDVIVCSGDAGAATMENYLSLKFNAPPGGPVAGYP